jgi:RHS repeat-associated protein
MATTTQLSENSHQGSDGIKAALCLASMKAKSNTASGMPVCLWREGIGSRSSGKERDAETGLDYFGARYYSGAQGRFTSPDKINHPNQSKDSFEQFISDPSRWNKYAYVSNNPLKYIDALGLEKYLAILMHQPAPGENRVYTHSGFHVDTGHTSVGIIDDVTKRFVMLGYHPLTDSDINLMAGGLKDEGVLKNDKDRINKVNASFFFKISEKDYQKLKQKLIRDFANPGEFDTVKNNCTDYAISFAKEIGIMLPDPQGAIGRFGSGSNPNMFGDALDREYEIYQQKVEEDKIRELRKLLGITN